MATLTNAITKINTTIPAGQRIISLNESHFDGSATGEGEFTLGYGEDRIPVYSLLKRTANRIEITLTEGTGGAGDSYTILIRVNPWQKVFHHVDTQPHDGDNPFGVRVPDLSTYSEVDTGILPIEITARDGETVTWTQNLPPIFDIGINAGAVGGSGTLGSLEVVIY